MAASAPRSWSRHRKRWPPRPGQRSWGMVVFHGSSMGISWSENKEFHGIPPKNHQNNGETEKKPPPFFRFGADIQWFNDEFMGRWCNMNSGWVRNIVSLWCKGMDIHKRKLFWCENLGTGVLIRGHAWLSVVQCCTCRRTQGLPHFTNTLRAGMTSVLSTYVRGGENWVYHSIPYILV